MERSIFPPDLRARIAQIGARGAVALALLAASVGLGVLTPGPSFAATVQQDAAKNPDKLFVDADQLVYDRDHNVVTATGKVVLYYKNRILQADRVVYDRNAKRVRANGAVKFTDEKGDVTYAPQFDLTDDFAAGFADEVQLLSTDKTRFTAPRVERSAGAVTVFDKGAYTACEPCQAHPERPALWQVRAARIIENQETHTIYFEHAWLDVYGVPVAYIPYFSAPDPTVTRATGLLAPVYTNQAALGTGVSLPYFFALAPNYDLTLTPTYYSLQGFAMDAEWRHRLENGEYSVRLAGIDQAHPSYFLPSPWGAGNRAWRGSLETQGKFNINESWKYGWNISLLSDRFYLADYRLTALDPSQYYLQDIVSTIYLRGQHDRGFFDLSGYRFQTTTGYLDSRQEPLAPVLDYHRTFALDPDKTNGIGGELKVEINAANVSRAEALYQSVGLQQFDTVYGLYSVCNAYAPGTTLNKSCLLRGVAGDTSHSTAQVSWQRKFVDPIGEEWTPFVFARLDGVYSDLNTSQSFTYGNSLNPLQTIPNGAQLTSSTGQPAFFNGASVGGAATAMPGIGLEYRFPFVSHSALGDQIVEPIAQVIVRPNEVLPQIAPNEDAQSLVFDETNLFAWNKYSGFDRVEGGTRLNYGLQYTASFANGGHANIVGGQSIQLAGQNSYAIADAANTGLNSGLDTTRSNYVLGETIAPFSSNLSFTSKQQFDSVDGSLARFDAIVSAKTDRWSANVDYGHYAAQPLLGWMYDREGVMANASYKLTDTLSVDGSVVFDMSRHFYDVAGQSTPKYYPTNYHFGFSYGAANCTTIKASYTSIAANPFVTIPTVRDQTFLVEIDLRTLGDVKAGKGVN